MTDDLDPTGFPRSPQPDWGMTGTIFGIHSDLRGNTNLQIGPIKKDLSPDGGWSAGGYPLGQPNDSAPPPPVLPPAPTSNAGPGNDNYASDFFGEDQQTMLAPMAYAANVPPTQTLLTDGTDMDAA